MKKFILGGFLLFTVIQSYAQQNQDKLLYLEKSEKFRRMKSTGTVLTVGGGIAMVVGIVTLLNSSVTTTSYGNQVQTSTEGNPTAGVVAYIVGSAGVGAGIPLWIIGANNERKYNRKLEALRVGVNLNPQRTGLSLTCRF